MYNDMPEDKIQYRVEIEEQEEGLVVYLCTYTNADEWGFNIDSLGEKEELAECTLDEEKSALVKARKLSAKHNDCDILLNGFEVEKMSGPTITLEIDNDTVCSSCGSDNFHVNIFWHNKRKQWFHGEDEWGTNYAWCNVCDRETVLEGEANEH